ncbi:MAG TPA: hypothetical protein VNO14_07685, partial [Blastocatellia bacterium]|nr:hypothetical protein [Blastocatellia bacterium]
MPRKDKSKADSRASIGAGAAARRVPVSSPGIKSSSLYGIIPFMLAVLSSLNSLWNGFASDDSHQVVANAFIKNVSNLPYAFTTSVWSFAADDIVFSVDPYYRPLFNILFTINYALFGTTAWGWHLTNVLIHAAVTLLVYAVIIEIAE